MNKSELGYDTMTIERGEEFVVQIENSIGGMHVSWKEKEGLQFMTCDTVRIALLKSKGISVVSVFDGINIKPVGEGSSMYNNTLYSIDTRYDGKPYLNVKTIEEVLTI